MTESKTVSSGSLPTLIGTSGPDVLRGDDTSEIIRGEGGADRIYGNGGDDIISGGLGRDILDGGAGADVYVYNNVTESYQGGGQDHADLIRNFVGAGNDRIDVSALGFTGLGDGHGGTLTVAVNDAGTRTYLKSYAYGEDGNRFEVAFDGDIKQYLTEDKIIFADTNVAASSDQIAALSVDSELAPIELLGVLPDDPSVIG
ncbi:hypothetical protein PVE_P0089 (plasmid) [Pseudomonas veronii 1YdBTEX2]|uniref:Calcium-binding protein n=2 Tax=Pseudomonas veronii TaxID=76761 RepID=A0A7Y1AD24_PSEVE|nr:hypothetical protein [Pseudomonas veronii]NMY13533.1 hypothetical protein [Pseudomonas veronii]SBW85133.1 hypothetical protein PVE_P0089 [Pseudomonas veronii 1YdBTEX2]